ncbi:MAG: acyltransferase domain-containing protein [Acidobacteria bacterium]|nr:acyltransferase domain-containing protein [Acidobacteriota bacterium]
MTTPTLDAATRAGEPGDALAVIGMAGRFPGARNIEEFWQNLRDGVESVTFFSDEELLAAGVASGVVGRAEYVKARGVLDDVELFDAGFFDFTSREATMTDPQHRLFLEHAWEAMERAGYAPGKFTERVGVFGGESLSSYFLHYLYTNPALIESAGELQTAIGNDHGHLANTVSYKLNLKGPALNVQTACSTSLVTVHLACQSLLHYECDMALAGGVSVSVPQTRGAFYQRDGIVSPDGHCRAFDAQARGTVKGSGVGVVLLKRLTDALAAGDTIQAVIKATAINNDGSVKVSYTAPSVGGQADVIAEALALAAVDPATVGYVETHGTGTALGDAIEIAALTRAFGVSSEARAACAIGSVKTNVGHLDAAAGVAGLIKTALALKHKQLPPSLHFEQANPNIDFSGSPFYVNTRLAEWRSDGRPRRAGVSSFGIGGTNAHVVLEEAPASRPSDESAADKLLVLSAKTASALERVTDNLVKFLARHPEANLADVAYTLQVGRAEFGHRRALACRDVKDALGAFTAGDTNRVLTGRHEGGERQPVFMFPGQGGPCGNIIPGLYEGAPAFREQVDHCAEIVKSHLGLDLSGFLYAEGPEAAEQPKQAELAQVLLFINEYALAAQWESWGVRPGAVVGHSLGEYAAACRAGVFSLPDALMLVAERGRLIQQLPHGAMLFVALSERDVEPLLHAELSLAASNGPTSCVLAGTFQAVARVERQLAEEGLHCQRLHTSHAFHSAMTEPALAPFLERVRQVELSAPHIPCLSGLTGTWMTADEATDPHYWVRHIRETVRFAAAVKELWQEPGRVLLEVGPGQTLSELARLPGAQPAQVVFSSLPRAHDGRSNLTLLLETAGRLWLAGVAIDWPGLHAGERRRRAELPTYPFERRRHWVEGAPPAGAAPGDKEAAEMAAGPLSAEQQPPPSSPDGRYAPPANERERIIMHIWAELFGLERVGAHDDFFALGGSSLLALQIASRLRAQFQIALPLSRLFAAPTPAKLAEVVAESQLKEQEAEELELLLAEIESLPADKVQAALARLQPTPHEQS